MARAELIHKTFTRPDYFLALGLGSGLAPVAPGTFGSAAALPFVLLLMMLPWWGYLALVGLALGFGIWLCDRVAADMAVKDPGAIVFDEFVGIWITFLFLPEGWYWWVAGFAVFRFFDVLKPWPVSWFDRQLVGGLGIMMDDVAAGIYSLMTLQGVALAISMI